LQRPTLRLTLACDNACVFCAQRGLQQDAAAQDSWKTALTKLRERSDEVTFVGGEPALVADLPEIVAAASALGFRGIGLQTNGRVLATSDLIRRLQLAGLTDLHVSLHGTEAAVHDYHAGRSGAFAAILSTISIARSRGVTTVATTVLTRSNYRVLADFPRLLQSCGVAAWQIAVPRAAGVRTGGADITTPRLALAVPYALQAIDAAHKLRLPAFVQGAPLCLLGPFAAFALPDEPRAFAAVCATCPSRAHCPGVDGVYLAQFQGDELAAKPAAAGAKLPGITRLFVGVGELTASDPGVPPAAQPHPGSLLQLGMPSATTG
jgi:hypothetical protein